MAKGVTETYRLYIDSVDYYSIHVMIDGVSIINTLDSKQCFADIVLKQGNLHSIQIDYVERRGETKLILSWESDSVEKEIIPSSQLYNTLYSTTTPFLLTVIPQNTDPQSVTLSTGWQIAVVDVQETMTLTSLDVFKNIQIHQNDLYYAVISDGTTTVNGVVTATSNGVYQLTYALHTTGIWQMHIFIQINGVGSQIEIANSPFQISLTQSGSNSANAILSNLPGKTGLTNAVIGHTAEFLVTLYDSSNNRLTSGGDTVTAQLLNGLGVSVGIVDVIDNLDGSYTVQYYLNTVKGTYTVKVIINGDTVNAKTTNTLIISDSPSGTHSLLTYPAVTLIGAPTTLSIQAYDKWGNQVSESVLPVYYQIDGNHGEITGQIPVSNQPTGLYTQSVTIPDSTNTSNTQCGSISVSAYFLKNGLDAKYYTN